MSRMEKKLLKAGDISKELTNFCLNKVDNPSPQSTFGKANLLRQKIIKEVYLLHLVPLILEKTLKKYELELFQSFNEGNKNKFRRSICVSNEESLADSFFQNMSTTQKAEQGLDKKRFADYIKSKISFCDSLYEFLRGACQGNFQNEELVFTKIPLFQLHAKFLPSAIETLISITNKNEYLLNEISKSYRDYNIHEIEEGIGTKQIVIKLDELSALNIEPKTLNESLSIFKNDHSVFFLFLS